MPKYILKDVFEIGKKNPKIWKITQKFGWTPFALKMQKRFEETGKQLYRYGIHTGLDFGVREEIVQSPISGVCVLDDDANDSGRGIALSIWDEKQLIGCRFYHLKENFLYEGERITAGQDIAISGKTAGDLTIGNAWHLHFEIVETDIYGRAYKLYGGAIDPLGENILWEK